MKKLLLNLTIVLCTTITVFAQNISFPDANFKAHLTDSRYTIDANNDKEISIQEAEAVTGTLSIGTYDVESLEGIEYFKNITGLNCTVDFNVTGLLKNLDVSKNLKLTKLNCSGNNLKSLDVSKNLQLTYLSCSNDFDAVCVAPIHIKNLTVSESWIKKIINCINTVGDFPRNPINLTSNTIFTENLNNYTRGYESWSQCITGVADSNIVDLYFYFTALSTNDSIEVVFENQKLLSSVELQESNPYKRTCITNTSSNSNKRIYKFSNLKIGEIYRIRLEVGDTSPIGLARIDGTSNNFSVKLNPSVTGIESDELIYQNKTLQSIFNLQGIEVDKNYNGLVIYRYTDGTTQKVMQ